MSKAIFESQDTHQYDGVAETSATPGGDKKYIGVERRRTNRRSGRERRTEVRFDPGSSSDRRQNKGRRADDFSPDFW